MGVFLIVKRAHSKLYEAVAIEVSSIYLTNEDERCVSNFPLHCLSSVSTEIGDGISP